MFIFGGVLEAWGLFEWRKLQSEVRTGLVSYSKFRALENHRILLKQRNTGHEQQNK
jgi:hypothetical protein